MSIEHILKTIRTAFINISKNGFTYEFQGNILRRNMESTWFLHCVTMSPYNVFVTTTDRMKHTLKVLDNMNINDLPYGLAMVEDSRTSWNEHVLSSGSKVTSHKVAKSVTFIHKDQIRDLFYKKQRERKMWWRKLAQNPSRFVLTEARKLENHDVVDIEAQFSFGNIIVESIIYQHDVQKLFTEVTNSEHSTAHVQMVEQLASLDWGCLALLSDSFEDGKSNQMLLHPKISPYKVAFYIAKKNDEIYSDIEKLNRFIIYLNNILRTKGLETILTCTKEVFETSLVPFVVIVDKTSLKNGIIHIRSRSTTIAEEIHFTDLLNYIAVRCGHSV